MIEALQKDGTEFLDLRIVRLKSGKPGVITILLSIVILLVKGTSIVFLLRKGKQ